MSTASEIKAHLKAVEETRQITNAMYLLSTSRMKQAMQNIDFNLYYMKTLRSNMKQILSKTLENGLSDKFIIDKNKFRLIFFKFIYIKIHIRTRRKISKIRFG